MAYSKARGKAQANWEKKAYFRCTVRFPAEMESLIRQKSGGNINGYINKLVMADCLFSDGDVTREKFEDSP